MRDNAESSPEILEGRFRSKRNQTNLNIELGLSNRRNISTQSGTTGGGSVGGGVGQSFGGGSVIGTSTGGGGGSGTLCFSEETKVTMFDGKKTSFEFIFRFKDNYIGQSVLSYDEDNNPVAGEITHIIETPLVYNYVRVFFDDNEDWNLSTGVMPNHRYYTPEGEYVEISKLSGKLVMTDGERASRVTKIVEVEIPHGRCFYNLTVKPCANYVANGKRVHNSKPADIEQQQQ